MRVTRGARNTTTRGAECRGDDDDDAVRGRRREISCFRWVPLFPQVTRTTGVRVCGWLGVEPPRRENSYRRGGDWCELRAQGEKALRRTLP